MMSFVFKKRFQQCLNNWFFSSKIVQFLSSAQINLFRWLAGNTARIFYVLKIIWFTKQGHWNFETALINPYSNRNVILVYLLRTCTSTRYIQTYHWQTFPRLRKKDSDVMVIHSLYSYFFLPNDCQSRLG